MKTLEMQKLIPYIKDIVNLETSVYEQEMGYSNTMASIVAPDIKRRQLDPPENKKDRLVKPEYPSNENKTGGPALGLACSILLLIVCSTVAYASSEPTIWIVLAVFSGILTIAAVFSLVKAHVKTKEKVSQYQKALDQYNRECQRCDEEFEREKKEYIRIIEEDTRQYEANKKQAEGAYRNARLYANRLQVTLQNTKETLEKYYDLDVIFPKYRNLIAMSSFLEYFETGRCTELAGPNGAYNLYESELRQNIIIGQLGQVVNQLEQIKQNQFVLYQELNKANKNISKINEKVSRIMVASEQAAVNSEITAYCSEITAANTAFLAAIATYE